MVVLEKEGQYQFNVTLSHAYYLGSKCDYKNFRLSSFIAIATTAILRKSMFFFVVVVVMNNQNSVECDKLVWGNLIAHIDVEWLHSGLWRSMARFVLTFDQV